MQKIRTRVWVLAAVAVVVLFPAGSSGVAGDDAVVMLRSGPVSPPGQQRVAAVAGKPGRMVVRFHRPTGAASRALLAGFVDRIDAPLPGQAFLVTMPAGRAAALAGLPGVDWVTPYEAHHKLAPDIAAVDPAVDDQQPVIVLLHLFADADLSSVAAEYAAAGLNVEGAGRGLRFHRIVLTMSPGQVEAWRDRFAARNDVFWVGRRYRRTLVNDTSIWVGQSGLDDGGATTVFDHGIYGEGQVAAVLDTGLDADACQFRDGSLGLPPAVTDGSTTIDPAQRKVLAVDFLWTEDNPAVPTDWDSNNHGTHVAGTLAGDDLANLLTHDPNDGMAPGAKLVIQDGGYQVDDCADMPAIGCPASSLTPILQQSYDQGARFHSNSWGDNENAATKNHYTDLSEDVDEFMWLHKDFLALFAAGNNGPDAATVGSPSTAKNCISVGATLRGTSAGSIAWFSSRGPTDDGRYKPDVTFPGYGIISAGNDGNINSNNCGAASMSGTSMACPGAAGLSVLARAYYADGFYPSGAAVPGDGFDATAALVKASVINSAVPLLDTGPIPSFDQGWGRILLDDVMYFTGDARKLHVDDHVDGFTGPADPAEEYAVEVLDPAVPLKVTLVWTDYPSTPAAAVHLVNDLDLVLEGPAGTFLGNVFTGGVSATGGTADRLNNVEQVLLQAPPAGSYTVRVSAFAVPNGPQPYALVITGDADVSCSPHPRYRSYTVDDAAPGGNGDGVLDPGETAVVAVTLENTGGDTATGISAILSSALPGPLKIYRAAASWPDLAPGAEAVSEAPHYEVTLEPSAVCGAELPVDLAITGNGFGVGSSFSFAVGTDHDEYPSTDTPMAIPARELVGLVSTINVAGSFTLAEVDVALNIAHDDIGELRVVLHSPAGTEVTLHDGSSAGTSGIHTVYDDLTAPEGGTMGSFAGEDSAGDWTLTVYDDQSGTIEPGTLEEWSLRLRATVPFLCNPLACGEPAPPPVGDTLLVDKSGGDAVLSWFPASGASDYHVWRDAAPGFDDALYAGASGGATTFTDMGALTAPDLRYYLVRSVNVCNWESE